MRIDIWSDVTCPWCFIGKKRLEKALEAFPHRDEVEIVHRSYQLDPTAPRGEVHKQREVLQQRYGLDEGRVREMMENVERTAASEGVEMRLLEGLTGNTWDAHRVLHLAREKGLQDAVLERLYKAHFVEGRSIFDARALAELGAEAGLEAEEIRQVLEAGRYDGAIQADVREAQSIGVRGVPFFVIDRRYGVSGAQPKEAFTEVLEKAWAESHPVSLVQAATGDAEACGPDGCELPSPK